MSDIYILCSTSLPSRFLLAVSCFPHEWRTFHTHTDFSTSVTLNGQEHIGLLKVLYLFSWGNPFWRARLRNLDNPSIASLNLFLNFLKSKIYLFVPLMSYAMFGAYWISSSHNVSSFSTFTCYECFFNLLRPFSLFISFFTRMSDWAVLNSSSWNIHVTLSEPMAMFWTLTVHILYFDLIILRALGKEYKWLSLLAEN